VEKPKILRLAGQPSRIHHMTYQKQLENAQYFNCLDSMITNDARFKC